jgi:hypothetical protein
LCPKILPLADLTWMFDFEEVIDGAMKLGGLAKER